MYILQFGQFFEFLQVQRNKLVCYFPDLQISQNRWKPIFAKGSKLDLFLFSRGLTRCPLQKKSFLHWTFPQPISGVWSKKICFILAVFSCLSFKEDGQSFISGGILERRICWIACSQVLRKLQGTEKSTLCKRDVQLQQAEPQLRFCQSSEQIFSLFFPPKQPARVVPPRHPAWGAQLQWEVERINISLLPRTSRSWIPYIGFHVFHFSLSRFPLPSSGLIFHLQVQTELLLPRCRQQESWWVG